MSNWQSDNEWRRLKFCQPPAFHLVNDCANTFRMKRRQRNGPLTKNFQRSLWELKNEWVRGILVYKTDAVGSYSCKRKDRQANGLYEGETRCGFYAFPSDCVSWSGYTLSQNGIGAKRRWRCLFAWDELMINHILTAAHRTWSGLGLCLMLQYDVCDHLPFVTRQNGFGDSYSLYGNPTFLYNN